MEPKSPFLFILGIQRSAAHMTRLLDLLHAMLAGLVQKNMRTWRPLKHSHDGSFFVEDLSCRCPRAAAVT